MATPKPDTLNRTHSLKARGDSMITPGQLAELQGSVPKDARVHFTANTRENRSGPAWHWEATWGQAQHDAWMDRDWQRLPSAAPQGY